MNLNSNNNYGAKAETILIILLAISVIPFCILAFFNHPAGADDYFFWDRMEKAGFVKALLSLYNNWSGRFFTHAELLVFPFIYRTVDGYKLFTLILMLAFFLSLYLLVTVLFRNSIDLKERILFSLSIIFMYFYGMDTISQGFYWLISTIVYHNTIILILFFIIFYILFCNEKTSWKKYIYIFILCVTAASISGSNEIALAITFMLVTLFFITDIFFKKKINPYLLPVIITIFISSYIVFKSSGTQLRADKFSANRDLFNSVFLSIQVLFEQFLNWTFASPLLVLTILLIPVFLKIAKQKNENYNMFCLSPFFSLVTGFIFLFVCIFLSVYSIGHYPFGRTLNFLYFLFLILWFYNALVIIFYLNKKYENKKITIPKFVYAILIFAMVIFIFAGSNLRTAYSDLFTGTAYRFNIEMNERYKYLAESKSDTIVLNSLQNFPKTIYPFDLTDDEKTIYNQWYARHFKKKSVIVKKSEPKP